jgi:hypothetical protein
VANLSTVIIMLVIGWTFRILYNRRARRKAVELAEREKAAAAEIDESDIPPVLLKIADREKLEEKLKEKRDNCLIDVLTSIVDQQQKIIEELRRSQYLGDSGSESDGGMAYGFFKQTDGKSGSQRPVSDSLQDKVAKLRALVRFDLSRQGLALVKRDGEAGEKMAGGGGEIGIVGQEQKGEWKNGDMDMNRLMKIASAGVNGPAEKSRKDPNLCDI